MKKTTLLLVTLLVVTSVYGYQVKTPEENMSIEEPTRLVPGEYTLTEGITTTADLTCNQTILKGEFTNTGITAEGNITVENCTVKHYNIGVEKTKEVTLKNNTIKENSLNIRTLEEQNYQPDLPELNTEEKENNTTSSEKRKEEKTEKINFTTTEKKKKEQSWKVTPLLAAFLFIGVLIFITGLILEMKRRKLS